MPLFLRHVRPSFLFILFPYIVLCTERPVLAFPSHFHRLFCRLVYNAPHAVTVIMQAHKHTFVTKSVFHLFLRSFCLHDTSKLGTFHKSHFINTLHCTALFQKLNYTLNVLAEGDISFEQMLIIIY